MKKMDRWLPKGNPPTPSSSEGAFERFLTAAIATIITIIFSWRMLDKINEDREEDEYAPERHKLGHASSLSQTASFVSFSPPTPQERSSLDYLGLGETSHFRSQSAESHSVVSLYERASRGDFNTGGFRFQLETIIRVPVDFPLCGDNPERSTRAQSAKNRQHAEASGNPGDSMDVFKLGLARDTDNQLLDCFIDRTSPGAGQVGDTQQQHDPAITANRSLALLQPIDRLNSRTELQTRCRDNTGASTETNRNSISDSSLEFIPNDLLDLTDSSIEEAGYACGENNSDLFLNASNDCVGDDDPNEKDYFQDISAEEEITRSPHTTDDTDSHSDDYFIALSDGRHHHFDQYDFDDDVQPRELDSDEELFCCSILEPIIEEDSDEITTSSEGDTSRSDKSSNKLQYTVNVDIPPYEVSESSRTATYNLESSAQFELEIKQDNADIILDEQNTKVAGRTCVPEGANYILDPDINEGRLPNINTALATDPDCSVSTGKEPSSVAHTVQVRAELFTPAVNNRANENSVTEENHSNIRWIGSSVDRFFSDSGSEQTREDNDCADFDNRLNQIDVDIIIDNAEDDSVFSKQFVPYSFMHTFSTRVEVEDSNSESDESVQTVISRKTSTDLEGSPQRGSYLTSGLRPTQEPNKRPFSDGVLYSSKRWIDEESRYINRRLRNVSEGGGAAFGEEDKSIRFTVDSLPGRSNYSNLQSYKSFTAQDLPTLTDDSCDSKSDIVPESIVTDTSCRDLRQGEFSHIDFRHRGEKANKHGRDNIVIETAPGGRLFESGEQRDHTDNVVHAREEPIWDFAEIHAAEYNDTLLGKETLQGEIITGFKDPRFEYSNTSQDTENKGGMDVPGRWVSYHTEEKGIDTSKKMNVDDDDEDWEEEVIEETFVLPLPPERGFLNALQNVKSMLDKSESDRSSQMSRDEEENEEDEEGEYQGSCVTTMIEVEGHGALGFTGIKDVTSGYRDQCSELERTDMDVKTKLGFKLNMDEYKSDEYATEEGWPVTRYVEKERVYIDDSVPSKTRLQDEDPFGDTMGRYRRDGFDNYNQRELDIDIVAKEKQENETDQQQEDDEEEEVHYVEEHIEVFRMKNYNLGRETFGSDKTKPLEWRNNDRDKLFFENRSTFYQPSSSSQYTLFGTNTETTLPEMTSDNLYTPLSGNTRNIPQSDEEMFSPYTNNSQIYRGPFPQNSFRNVFAQRDTHEFPSFADNDTRESNSNSYYSEGISRKIFTDDDPQGVLSLVSDAQQEDAPISKYDEFVRHILSKDIKLQTMEDSYAQAVSSQTDSILRGNVTSNQTLESSFTFPGNEHLQQKGTRVLSPTLSTEKYNTKREEAWRYDNTHEQDNREKEEPELVKKLRYVRTSTAQDEDELLKFRPSEEQHETGSFEASNRNSFELERGDPWSSGESKNTNNAGHQETRTETMPASNVDIKPSVSKHTHFSTNPRRFHIPEPISELSNDTVREATLPTDGNHPATFSTAENRMNENSYRESFPIKPPSPVWACVIAGPNFVEKTPTKQSQREPRSSSGPLRIIAGNRNTQFGSHTNKSDKSSDVETANVQSVPAVKPFTFSQATISLTSTLNTLPTASSSTKASAAATAHKLSEKVSQENIKPKTSDIKLPLVSSSAIKFLQERTTSQTSTLDRKDSSDLYQVKSDASNTKADADNAKEEKRKSGSSFLYYRGSNKDTELEDVSNKENDKKSAAIQHHPTSKTADKSHSMESTDDVLPEDSSSSSGTASPMTSFDSVEPARTSTHAQVSASSTANLTPSPAEATSWIPDSTKKPKSLKEIKKRYKQPYKSVLTQDASGFSLPKAAPFVVPDHLITPSRMKILQARNQFLSEQNLHTDPFAGEFTAHKESLTPTVATSASKDRKYTPRMNKQPTYRSQEQLEKILYMVNMKPGRSEGSLNVDCLHEDCILSEAGRREILDKTLSIDNLDARLHSRFGNMRTYTSGPMSDSFDPETNSDLFDLTFPYQDEFNRQLDRPASMGELRHASNYSTISGSAIWALTNPGSRYQDHVSPKQNKKSKSLGTLETKEDKEDFKISTRADGLHRPPSAHELRISKSLQKLNVPDWYKYVSVSNSGNFLPRYRSATSITSRATSASLASSPSTTPSISSNVVIKSRVQFPTTARNLRSPHASSKSAPTTPSLTSWVDQEDKTTPTSVKLPSESMRTAEKPQSLKPIPILPLDRIRFIVEKKKELARNDMSAVKQTFPLPIPHSPTVSQPSAIPPASESPTDSFDINAYNEDENPEEIIPEVIVSPTDPNVRSILKRPATDRKEWDDQRPLEQEVEHFQVKTDSRKGQDFAPTMTLFKAPVHISSDLPRKLVSSQVPEKSLVPQRPASIEITQTEKSVKSSNVVYNSDKKEQLISHSKEGEWRPLPIIRPSQQRTSLWSSSSSVEENKSKPDRPHFSMEQHSGNTRFESPDVFSETQPSILSPVTSLFPPTIVVTPDTPRPSESNYVDVVVVEPTTPVTILERAPVIRPPENKPFIAPVIEDHSIIDTPSYFTEYSTHHEPRTWSRSSESLHESDLDKSFGRQDIPNKSVHTTAEHQRTWSRSPESFHESDIHNSFDRQDVPSKPVEVEPRTWSRSSESFHESDPNNSFLRNNEPHNPVPAQIEPRTWSRSSESFHESDPNNSFVRNNEPHNPVTAQVEPRTWSRSSESFHESDPNNSFIRNNEPHNSVPAQVEPRTWSRSSESFHENDVNSFSDRRDVSRKPVESQAQPRSWSRSTESFHERDSNSSFKHNDLQHTPLQTRAETAKKRTWVPKPKPNRKLRSPMEPEQELTDSEYTNKSVLQSKFKKQESLEKFQYIKSPVESESQEESAPSEESSSENRFKIRNKQMYYPHATTLITRETDLERSYDSYSSRSTHTFQDLVQEEPYEAKTLNRKPTAQSSPNFSRSLDRVLERYTSQDEEQHDDVSEKDKKGSTPTEVPNRFTESARERNYTVSNGVNDINNLRQTEEYTEGNYDWDARSFINKALKDKRQHTDYSRTGAVYESQDRDFDSKDYDRSDTRPYGNVQHERSDSVYEESEPEYSNRDRIVDSYIAPRQQARDVASAEDLTYSVDSEQDSIREYPNFGSATGAVIKSRTMPSNWTMPGNSKSHMDLSETYDEPVTQRKPGRTWQPKQGRGLKHSTVKHAFSTGDILHKGSVTSLETKVSPEASPYKYKVAGSAFSSARPDVRAGLTTPPSARRESSMSAGTFTSSNETTV